MVTETYVEEFVSHPAPSPSAISWAAVIAGAVVAAAISLLVVSLGAGLGLAVAPGGRNAVAAFSVWAGIWLILTQWIASGFGGYLTGRLRRRWAELHVHEVFFRDTAHGLIAWALATLMVAVAVAAIGASGARLADARSAAEAYQLDTLFRSAKPDDSPSAAAAHEEAGRVLARSVADRSVSPSDRVWLNSAIITRTGVAPAEADHRVDAAVGQLTAAADTARKTASATGIFTALSMLIGALIASIAALLGGRQRDEHD